jgi:chromate transporter
VGPFSGGAESSRESQNSCEAAFESVTIVGIVRTSSNPDQQERVNAAPEPPLPTLFFSFLRLGLTSFGGPAMVKYIRDLAVTKNGWLSDGSMRSGIALCSTLPGATALQSAGYVGLKTRGFRGAVATFTAFVVPAFLLMLALSILYEAGQDIPAVVSIFRGLRAVIVAIVASAALDFARSTIDDVRGLVIVLAAAAALAFSVNPFLLIPMAGAAGVPLLKRVPDRGGPVGHGRTYLRPIAILLGCVALGLLLLSVVNNELLRLSLTMMRIDLFAFGGGFASLPLMQHEFVDAQQLISGPVFADALALGQVTPGPIVITATFVGYVVGGLLGATVAQFSILLPSFVMLVTVEPYFASLERHPLFRKAVAGILLSFVGLLIALAGRLAIGVAWTPWLVALALGAFIALRLKVGVARVVLAGAAVSLVLPA